MKWVKGQSGNPGGRVGRDKPFTEALIWAAKMEQDDTRSGMTKIQQAAVALLNKARKGDVPAWNAAADRVEGKPAQAVELGGADGGPVVLNVVTGIERADD